MTDLNGTPYNNEDFAGDGYLSRFPDPVFRDLLAELSTRDAAIATAIASQNASITGQINALGLPGYISLTSLAIGTGSRTFTLTQAASVPVGVYKAYSGANPANFMIVEVTTATAGSTTLATTSHIANGSGTFANWVIVSLNDVARRSYRSVAGDTLITISDIAAVVEVTAAGATVNADTVASLGGGLVVTIVNSSAGNVTFAPAGGDTVDGATSLVIPSNRSVTIATTASAWRSTDRQILSHDLVTGHSVSGLTAGHVLRATSATAMAFGALVATDLPAESQRAIRWGRIMLWRRMRRVF